MIKIEYSNMTNEQPVATIKANGHATNNQTSTDEEKLICCAVTTLFEHTANALDGYFYPVKADITRGLNGEGSYLIDVRDEGYAAYFFMALVNSLKQLSIDYPGNIQIIEV
jgi:uncharacterized protein YsxB (DUF464 family)